jgi:hypothetical protein
LSGGREIQYGGVRFTSASGPMTVSGVFLPPIESLKHFPQLRPYSALLRYLFYRLQTEDMRVKPIAGSKAIPFPFRKTRWMFDTGFITGICYRETQGMKTQLGTAYAWVYSFYRGWTVCFMIRSVNVRQTGMVGIQIKGVARINGLIATFLEDVRDQFAANGWDFDEVRKLLRLQVKTDMEVKWGLPSEKSLKGTRIDDPRRTERRVKQSKFVAETPGACLVVPTNPSGVDFLFEVIERCGRVQYTANIHDEADESVSTSNRDGTILEKKMYPKGSNVDFDEWKRREDAKRAKGKGKGKEKESGVKSRRGRLIIDSEDDDEEDSGLVDLDQIRLLVREDDMDGFPLPNPDIEPYYKDTKLAAIQQSIEITSTTAASMLANRRRKLYIFGMEADPHYIGIFTDCLFNVMIRNLPFSQPTAGASLLPDAWWQWERRTLTSVFAEWKDVPLPRSLLITTSGTTNRIAKQEAGAHAIVQNCGAYSVVENADETVLAVVNNGNYTAIYFGEDFLSAEGCGSLSDFSELLSERMNERMEARSEQTGRVWKTEGTFVVERAKYSPPKPKKRKDDSDDMEDDDEGTGSSARTKTNKRTRKPPSIKPKRKRRMLNRFDGSSSSEGERTEGERTEGERTEGERTEGSDDGRRRSARLRGRKRCHKVSARGESPSSSEGEQAATGTGRRVYRLLVNRYRVVETVGTEQMGLVWVTKQNQYQRQHPSLIYELALAMFDMIDRPLRLIFLETDIIAGREKTYCAFNREICLTDLVYGHGKGKNAGASTQTVGRVTGVFVSDNPDPRLRERRLWISEETYEELKKYDNICKCLMRVSEAFPGLTFEEISLKVRGETGQLRLSASERQAWLDLQNQEIRDDMDWQTLEMHLNEAGDGDGFDDDVYTTDEEHNRGLSLRQLARWDAFQEVWEDDRPVISKKSHHLQVVRTVQKWTPAPAVPRNISSSSRLSGMTVDLTPSGLDYVYRDIQGTHLDGALVSAYRKTDPQLPPYLEFLCDIIFAGREKDLTHLIWYLAVSPWFPALAPRKRIAWREKRSLTGLVAGLIAKYVREDAEQRDVPFTDGIISVSDYRKIVVLVTGDQREDGRDFIARAGRRRDGIQLPVVEEVTEESDEGYRLAKQWNRFFAERFTVPNLQQEIEGDFVDSHFLDQLCGPGGYVMSWVDELEGAWEELNEQSRRTRNNTVDGYWGKLESDLEAASKTDQSLWRDMSLRAGGEGGKCWCALCFFFIKNGRVVAQATIGAAELQAFDGWWKELTGMRGRAWTLSDIRQYFVARAGRQLWRETQTGGRPHLVESQERGTFRFAWRE